MNHFSNLVPENSDHSLLRRFQNGQEDAATRLYLRYAQRLQALASSKTANALATRFDPEDVVQSVFRTFFRRASKGLYDIPPGEELWQLLLVIALNKVRKLGTFHRAEKRDVARTALAEQLIDTDRSSPDQTAYQVLSMVVADLISELPESQQRIVRMRIDNHKVSEIAQTTKRSQRTVERVLRDFRLKLGKLIDTESKENGD